MEGSCGLNGGTVFVGKRAESTVGGAVKPSTQRRARFDDSVCCHVASSRRADGHRTVHVRTGGDG